MDENGRSHFHGSEKSKLDAKKDEAQTSLIPLTRMSLVDRFGSEEKGRHGR